MRSRSRMSGAAVVVLALWASAAPTLIYPAYIRAWHATTLETTLVFATYPAAMLIALTVFGNLSDMVGNRSSMLAGLVLLCGGTVVLILATDVGFLIAGRALVGLGVGAALPAATVEAGRPDARGRSGGTAVTVANAAGLIAALIVGGIAVEWWPDWPSIAYVVLLGAAVIVAVLLLTTTGDGRPRQPERWRFQPLTIARPRTRFLAGALAMCAAYSLGAVYLSVGAQFARDAVGSSDALVTSVILASSAASIGLTAILAGRLRPRLALVCGAVALAVGQAGMIVSGGSGQVWMLVVASIVGGAGYGFLFSAGITTVIRHAAPTHRAAATSTAYVFAYVVQAVVAVAVGAVSTAATLELGLVLGSAAVFAVALAAIVLHVIPVSGLPGAGLEVVRGVRGGDELGVSEDHGRGVAGR